MKEYWKQILWCNQKDTKTKDDLQKYKMRTPRQRKVFKNVEWV
jgi:hypothetical protein